MSQADSVHTTIPPRVSLASTGAVQCTRMAGSVAEARRLFAEVSIKPEGA
jgi:hypothetical protein